ncbi:MULTISPECIES: hypothetical protein [unclassified Actinotalea]|uniref:hypothetical protein n=1 Tax=unclassified Actinotalea TaxID=2638618 RepID=UPI0015F5E9D5|nr:MULTISPECIES: hypothetical protein [unclassified Actinotalea]
MLAPLAVTLLALAAGCAASDPPSGPPPEHEIPSLGPDQVWVVAISDPRGDLGDCAQDAAVAQALMTTDEPASHISMVLVAEATQADVERVLTCVDDALTSGDVTVTTTPG